MAKVNFPNSPSDGQIFKSFGADYTYSSTKGYWVSTSTLSGIQRSSLSVGAAVSASGSGGISYDSSTGEFRYTPAIVPPNPTAVYATAADLPLSGNNAGSKAFVSSTNRLYLWNGSGWFNIALLNTSPTITTGGDATYDLDSGGAATTITLAATDPEDVPIAWSYAVTAGSLGSTATISQADNVFTITPSTDVANAGAFSLTFTASDGVNTATSTSAFTLEFSVDWTAVSEQQKISASDGASSDNFGRSVSISNDGNTAIVGAPLENAGGPNTGAAYIFTRSGSTWAEQSKIVAADQTHEDTFGGSVGISGDGDTVVVTTNNGMNGMGGNSAYIFTRSGSTWTQQSKIVASDETGSSYFGSAVSVSDDGNTAILGAQTAGTAGQSYIFTRSGSTWTQQSILVPSDGTSGDAFGFSASLSNDGNTAIVGSRTKSTVGYSFGAAYIYTRSGSIWAEQSILLPDDASSGAEFGWSVSLSNDGNTAIVSAWRENSNAGSAYIFTRSGSTWTQQSKIVASDAAAGRFGSSVSVSNDGNTVIAGSLRESTGAYFAGAAYIFTRSGSTWTEQSKIQASDKQASDNFGLSSAVSGDGRAIIVGSYLEDTGGTDAGSAYIFVGG